MAIVLRCPGCDTRFEFDDDLEGKRIRCKNCGDMFRVEKPVRQKKTRTADDDDDDRPSSKGRGKTTKSDLKKRKSNMPLIILGSAAGVLLLTTIVIILVVRGKRRGPDEVTVADVVKNPSKVCPLQIIEKEVEQIIAPDSGSVFGILRKGDVSKRQWIIDIHDMASGSRRGRLELNDHDEPQSIRLSPDGKHVMIQERTGFGAFSTSTISVWNVDKKETIHPEPKWIIYAGPKNPRNPIEENDTLYRAEFLGNDQIVAVSTRRKLTTWTLANLEVNINAAYRGVPPKGETRLEPLGHDEGTGSKSLLRYQKQLAFNADHSKAVMWTGDGFVVVDCKEGFEVVRTDPISPQGYERPKAVAVAFSPDSSQFAAIIEHNGRELTLMIWSAKEQKAATTHSINRDHYKDAKALTWWGNKYVVTLNGGEGVEGILINAQSGSPTRQLMGPKYKVYGIGRDGRLWYPSSTDEAGALANVLVVDPVDAELANDKDLIEEIPPLKGTYLRRLWMEPTGILRKPTRDNPPRGERLIVMTSGAR